ncbi:MAG: carboxypeptidase-like regulatory domain-containing protein, partial [Bacteroidetes bacterium]|nr:carboxypeptidase-like regulatory domain-containing protein [Bacteroidota bacterium]
MFFGDKRFLVFLLIMTFLFLGIQEVKGQSLGSISGKVLDKNTQEPLIGATVILQGTSLGAQTDAEGKFMIKSIPTKSYNLVIQYIG